MKVNKNKDHCLAVDSESFYNQRFFMISKFKRISKFISKVSKIFRKIINISTKQYMFFFAKKYLHVFIKYQ